MARLTLPFHLQTDTSGVGVDAAMLQHDAANVILHRDAHHLAKLKPPASLPATGSHGSPRSCHPKGRILQVHAAPPTHRTSPLSPQPTHTYRLNEAPQSMYPSLATPLNGLRYKNHPHERRGDHCLASNTQYSCNLHRCAKTKVSTWPAVPVSPPVIAATVASHVIVIIAFQMTEQTIEES
ncbi:hypothetical protein E2C01_059683 [Portunus trituberculatus]|uniref:Uncharacterized protein n=1 Tax=Portunus trituberculatus TaxID=210409 RepID=A0A5B7H6J0_PORTR|nr:hypothetical protein [Portunus trituberculatus]